MTSNQETSISLFFNAQSPHGVKQADSTIHHTGSVELTHTVSE